MIQRKQSLWLFIAALLNAGVFYFDLYRADIGAVRTALRVADHYPSLLIALVMTILPLITIFMYKNRKRQVGMSAVGIIADISFVTMLLGRVSSMGKQVPVPANGTYWIGAVLPVISIIFLILSLVNIRKDEKLVRSTDRLR